MPYQSQLWLFSSSLALKLARNPGATATHAWRRTRETTSEHRIALTGASVQHPSLLITFSRQQYRTPLELDLMQSMRTGSPTKTLNATFTSILQVILKIWVPSAGAAVTKVTMLTANTMTGVATISIIMFTSLQPPQLLVLRTSSWPQLSLLRSLPAIRQPLHQPMSAKPQLPLVGRMRLSSSKSLVTSAATNLMFKNSQSVRQLASSMRAQVMLAIQPKKACTQCAHATPTASALTTCSTWTRSATA